MYWSTLRNADVTNRPPAVPPVCEAWLPGSSVNSSIRAYHKGIQFILATGDDRHMCAWSRYPSIQRPPAMPPVGESNFPRSGVNIVIGTYYKYIKLVLA